MATSTVPRGNMSWDEGGQKQLPLEFRFPEPATQLASGAPQALKGMPFAQPRSQIKSAEERSLPLQLSRVLQSKSSPDFASLCPYRHTCNNFWKPAIGNSGSTQSLRLVHQFLLELLTSMWSNARPQIGVLNSATTS